MEEMEITTPSKTYPVWIAPGLRHRLSALLAELPFSYSSFLIITDECVADHYLDDVLNALGRDHHVFHYIIKQGEEAKSFDVFYDCHTFALENELDRKSAVLALGGGVVGDLAGFVSATFMRGVGFIQMPTTLLAHDSSVGGKTAINHPLGKNMIGSFYQPDAVIFDTETLATLPLHELRSGFAEIVKHGLIYDVGLYDMLRNEITSTDDLKTFPFANILKRAIAVKAAIVRQDEKESGIRSHLNFGHTLGHAIEAELGYGQITHGEAVAIGMIYAMKLSEAYFGVRLPVNECQQWLEGLGFSVTIPRGLSSQNLITRMKRDKKAEKDRIRFVAMRKVGQVETVFVEDRLILETMIVDSH